MMGPPAQPRDNDRCECGHIFAAHYEYCGKHPCSLNPDHCRDFRPATLVAPFRLSAPNTSPEFTARIRKTAIEHGLDPDESVREFRAAIVWTNGDYTVFVRHDTSPIDGKTYTHLSIKREDRDPIDDFRVFQAIKNAIVGPEREAVQVYPAESQLVDSANQYHLWVMPEGYVRPYGFFTRFVSDDMRFDGAKQRRFAGE